MIIEDTAKLKEGKTGLVLPFKKNIFQIKVNKSIEIVIVHNPGKKNFHQDNVGIILEENKILEISLPFPLTICSTSLINNFGSNTSFVPTFLKELFIIL